MMVVVWAIPGRSAADWLRTRPKAQPGHESQPAGRSESRLVESDQARGNACLFTSTSCLPLLHRNPHPSSRGPLPRPVASTHSTRFAGLHRLRARRRHPARRAYSSSVTASAGSGGLEERWSVTSSEVPLPMHEFFSRRLRVDSGCCGAHSPLRRDCRCAPCELPAETAAVDKHPLPQAVRVSI